MQKERLGSVLYLAKLLVLHGEIFDCVKRTNLHALIEHFIIYDSVQVMLTLIPLHNSYRSARVPLTTMD